MHVRATSRLPVCPPIRSQAFGSAPLPRIYVDRACLSVCLAICLLVRAIKKTSITQVADAVLEAMSVLPTLERPAGAVLEIAQLGAELGKRDKTFLQPRGYVPTSRPIMPAHSSVHPSGRRGADPPTGSTPVRPTLLPSSHDMSSSALSVPRQTSF